MPRRPTGRPPGRPRHPEPLTPAEQRVLEHLREGLPNAEIGVRLGISPDAVKYHVSNMLGKLELDNREQLAQWRQPTGVRRVWLGIPLAVKWAVGGTAAAIAAIAVVGVFAFGGDQQEDLDLYTGIISLNIDGEPADGTSLFPSISGDGRYVAFESDAPDLVPNDTNGVSDIFLFDRVTREMRRISVGIDGEEANGPSHRPAISADGRYVAFDSEATNLVPNDTNHELESALQWAPEGTAEMLQEAATDSGSQLRYFLTAGAGSDIFVVDLNSRETELVSVDSEGEPGGLGSFGPTISADGRFVAFESAAPNFAGLDRGRNAPTLGISLAFTTDIFVRDRLENETNLVSQGTRPVQESFGSGLAAMSSDGEFIAFASQMWSPGAVPSQIEYLLLWERATDTVSNISLPEVPAGSSGTWSMTQLSRPAVSENGPLIAASARLGLRDGTPELRGVFLFADDSLHVPSSDGPIPGPWNSVSVNGDGSIVVWTSLSPEATGTFIHSTESGITEKLALPDGIGWLSSPTISEGGAWILGTALQAPGEPWPEATGGAQLVVVERVASSDPDPTAQ